MRKNFLASIAAGLVIFSGVITPLFGLTITHAQEGATTFDGETPNSSTNLTTQNGTTADTNPKNITTPDLCSADKTFTCSLMSSISEVIMFVPLSFATISGMVFDYSIWNSIQSGTYTRYDQYDSADPSSEGIVVMGWKLVRDFTNLLFIFALFVVAFTLILDLDGGEKVSMTSNPKRTLARILMMALLVNFSFFLARVVIDTTNQMAQQFYTKMDKAPNIGSLVGTNSDQTSEVQSFYANQPSIHSIATRIISQINPQNFLLDKNGAAAEVGTGKYANLFLLSFIAAFFGLFLTYIFISIAILFIGRTIGLYLAVIISPLAFVSYTVPFLQKQPYIGFDDWMKQFMGLAFMAPIFLFFTYIGVQFLSFEPASGTGSVSIAAQVIFKFALVGMFFTLAKNISKDMSGKIGDMATSFVTGAATSVMAIGAAAATGGGSAAWMATKRQAASNLDGASRKILGDEKTDAIRSRMGGLKNFRTFGNNPGAALAGLGGMVTGSKVPGQIYEAGQEGKDLGVKMNRVNNIKNIREERLANEAATAKKKIDDAQKAKEAAEAEAKKQATRTTYNYDQRKTAMDAKDTQSGPKPTFGDGSAKMKDSDFSPKQQERILNKAIAAEAKRSGGQTTPPTQSTTAPAGPETPMKATNTFTGDGKFDRPVEKPSGLVDVNGQPMSKESLDANQKLESARLARLYENAEREKKNTVHVDNLEVKNLKVNPTETRLPSRNSNGSMTPQNQASTLLSGIQMAPRASSGVLNYKSSDFAEKKSSPNESGSSKEDLILNQINTKTPQHFSDALDSYYNKSQPIEQQVSTMQKTHDILMKENPEEYKQYVDYAEKLYKNSGYSSEQQKQQVLAEAIGRYGKEKGYAGTEDF